MLRLERNHEAWITIYVPSAAFRELCITFPAMSVSSPFPAMSVCRLGQVPAVRIVSCRRDVVSVLFMDA